MTVLRNAPRVPAAPPSQFVKLSRVQWLCNVCGQRLTAAEKATHKDPPPKPATPAK